MNYGEAKKYSRDIVAAYFGDDHVFFAEQKMAKKPIPYLTVKFTGLGRNEKITKYDEESQCYKDYRQKRARMEINLYTSGHNVAPEDMEPVYENTAVGDMDDYLQFLNSDEITDDMTRHDIVISIAGEIRDLSGILNTAEYRYRAMAEFDVRFTDSSYGLYGQNAVGSLPNASGGGSPEMISNSYIIEDIEMKGEVK